MVEIRKISDLSPDLAIARGLNKAMSNAAPVACDYQAMRKSAMGFARKKALLTDEQIEDFAQEFCLRNFTSKQAFVMLSTAYVDFLSKEFGNHRTITGTIKSKSRFQDSDLSETIEDLAADRLAVDDVIAEQERRSYVHALLNNHDYTVYRMLACGFSEKEVGSVLGVTEGRISQIKTSLVRKCQTLPKPNTELQVDWITL